MNIVILAEKANAAKDIAEALELNNMNRLENGFYNGNKDNNNFIITYTQGHCVRLKEPDEIDPKYKKWQIKTLPISFSENDLKPLDSKKFILKSIKGILKNADIIINAGDAGREGELIQRWVLKVAGYRGEVGRLWVSSLTKNAIRAAYENIIGYETKEKNILYNLYQAGEARAIMDKYLGYNYSRLLSLTKTDGITVNFGRCKTPLTHAIITRDIEIENFVKQTFYYIKIECENGLNATYIDKNQKRIEFKNKNEALDIANSLTDTLSIVKIEKIEKTLMPPMPYDILNLQKIMSKKYDFDADKTLSICQKLYDTYKILSYPRTDSRYLTSDLMNTVHSNLEELNFGEFKNYIEYIKDNTVPAKYFNDKKVADHHGIIPIIPEQKKIAQIYDYELNKDEKKVFDEVVKNFISLFLLPYKYNDIKIISKIEDKYFMTKTKCMLEEGFKICYRNEEDDDSPNQALNINIDDSLIITNKNVIKDNTKPKSHYTTETILDYMRIHNIGTGATRDRLIKELTEKKGSNANASVEKDGRYFISTSFGRKIDALIPDHLKSIELLSMLEDKLKQIEHGTLSKEIFLKDIEVMFMADYEQMLTTQIKIKSDTNKLDLFCPICKKPLKENSWAYSCTGWNKDNTDCNFSIPKTIANKKIPKKEVKELLINGRTNKKIKGFKSKKGFDFDAYLKLEVINDKGKIIFDFNE